MFMSKPVAWSQFQLYSQVCSWRWGAHSASGQSDPCHSISPTDIYAKIPLKSTIRKANGGCIAVWFRPWYPALSTVCSALRTIRTMRGLSNEVRSHSENIMRFHNLRIPQCRGSLASVTPVTSKIYWSIFPDLDYISITFGFSRSYIYAVDYLVGIGPKSRRGLRQLNFYLLVEKYWHKYRSSRCPSSEIVKSIVVLFFSPLDLLRWQFKRVTVSPLWSFQSSLLLGIFSLSSHTPCLLRWLIQYWAMLKQASSLHYLSTLDRYVLVSQDLFTRKWTTNIFPEAC